MEKNGLGDPLPSKNACVGDHPHITSAAGAPVESNQDAMTVGARGPMLLQDVQKVSYLHSSRNFVEQSVSETNYFASAERFDQNIVCFP